MARPIVTLQTHTQGLWKQYVTLIWQPSSEQFGVPSYIHQPESLKSKQMS